MEHQVMSHTASLQTAKAKPHPVTGGILLQRKCACGSTAGLSGECDDCKSKKLQGVQTKLTIGDPGDRYEQEADRVAEQVMQGCSGAAPIPIGTYPSAQAKPIQRQGSKNETEPDPLTEGLGTVAENLGENNPAFSTFTEDLAARFLSEPPALSVGVPVFLGTNYAFLWGMAMVNPAMRRHFDDFNLALLPGIVPQFPVKTFTYRILNAEQTQFEFDFGLDASALIEAFNEGVLNTQVSTLSFESTGDLDTRAASPLSLSALQINLGLFDDGLMLSGGFRGGISPYPLLERNALTGETSRIVEQAPPLPDLFPQQRDVRFMVQLDLVRLYNHFNPDRTPIRSLPLNLEGDVADQPLRRKANADAYESFAAPEETVRTALSSSGLGLDRDTRRFMESRFGYDFGRVQIHTDAAAARSALGLNARAYTLGRDIVFAPGQYAPGTHAGRHLLAHELAHVVQQSPAAASGVSPQGVAPARLQRMVFVKPDAAAADILGQFNKLCPGKFGTAKGKGFSQITASCAASDRTKNKSCGCLCDVAHDIKRQYSIDVAPATKTESTETLHDGTTAKVPASTVFPGTSVGDNPAITMASSKGSNVEFGAFKPDGSAFWYDNWRILAHELCGHGRLKQSQGGSRGCRAGHDSTIDTENEIAAEHGGENRGNFGDSRQGESFLNPDGDRSKVAFFQCNGLHHEKP
jgi:hypothetical protein